MIKTKPFEPAFRYSDEYPQEGLTKREYFAAMALQGLIAHYGVDAIDYPAYRSVTIADELIKVLNEL